MTMRFTCNVCGALSGGTGCEEVRDDENCGWCRSTVSHRSIVHSVSETIFGKSIPLPDFPVDRKILGVGLSDWEGYAVRLADKFDYRNTFFRELPRLDICAPPRHLLGALDFVVSANVFDRVLPPVGRAFAGASQLLKPGGHLILSVPYSAEGEGCEHYPDLDDYRTMLFEDRCLVVIRNNDGAYSVRPDPVLPEGPDGGVELRRMSLDQIVQCLAESGFDQVVIHDDEVPQYGISHKGVRDGLPIVARKAPAEERNTA